MATSTGGSVFEAAVLASGLVTQEQLDEAKRDLRPVAVASIEAAAAVTRDDLIAARLIDAALLNAWQVEQLKQGRTKFKLGPYRVIDSLGQGGMGQVFKAEHSLMGRIVAIKVLPLHKSTPDTVAYFTREMRAHAQLDHENLVRAFDAGRDGSVYYLVTEFVPGTNLRRLVRSRGKLTMPEAASIIAQAARGLQCAHERGMIHRDVKPANILVSPDGRTKVSDVGLASFLDVEDESDPREGKVVGTSDYLSPEQIMSPTQVSVASDIYSLGCTLYYAVTGKVPFPGGTTSDKVRRHSEHRAPDVRHIDPYISVEFSTIIARMLEKDPNKRFATAAQVAEALTPWLDPTPPAIDLTWQPPFAVDGLRAARHDVVVPDLGAPTKAPAWVKLVGNRTWSQLARDLAISPGALALILAGTLGLPLILAILLLIATASSLR